MRQLATGLILALLLAGLGGGAATAQSPATTELVSVSMAGVSGNGDSDNPSISADGRYVAFQSSTQNLVANDSNGQTDIFVRDRLTGTTERVSISTTGAQAGAASFYPSISADGRYVAFQSYAANLVPNDTNYAADVFVRDRQAGTTERVSVSSSGLQATGPSDRPSVSADGRHVAFQSSAANLVAGDTNWQMDVFVRDRILGTTERASVSGAGAQGNGGSDSPSLSGDGRYVAFRSYSGNLVPNDTNGVYDVFVRDRVAGTTERVSVSSAGLQVTSSSEWPALSADGRYVAFQSSASGLVAGDTNWQTDIFVRDRVAGTTERVSVSGGSTQASRESFFPSISSSGRYVAFQSYASNLVPDDTNNVADVFVHDRLSHATERASVSAGGAQGNRWSTTSALSADGRYVVFSSNASTLVSGDTNSRSDVFVRDRGNMDTTAPTTAATISGTVGNNGWYTSIVTIALAATDEGSSGVRDITYSASGAQAMPATTVAGATVQVTVEAEGETTLAFYARDNAGNVEAARAATVRIDTTRPSITISAPTANAAYLLGQVAAADYGCSDGGSGLESCVGTAPAGGALSTASVGARGFEVSAADRAGNSARRSLGYAVTYGVRLLQDQGKPANAGATIPIRLQLVDAGGDNVSSPGVAVTAVALSPSGSPGDAGKANPDNRFRYDTALGGTGGYIYNLSTRDLAAGSLSLSITVAGDPMAHSVPFQVK